MGGGGGVRGGVWRGQLLHLGGHRCRGGPCGSRRILIRSSSSLSVSQNSPSAVCTPFCESHAALAAMHQ